MDGNLRIYGIHSPGREAIVGDDLTTWADLKYARGLAHLDDVGDLARSWDAGGHTWLDLSLSDDRQTVSAFLRVEQPPPLDEMALRLGDALHCFRGALDALTWELCHLDGDVPRAGVEKRIYFPCTRKESEWVKQLKGPLASMPAEFQKRIRDYQPIDDGSPPSVVVWLDRLNNQDKHRGAIRAMPNVRAVKMPLRTSGATGGMTINFVEPIRFVDGALAMTLDTTIPVELLRTSTPVGLSYTVDDGYGNSLDLDHLARGLRKIGGALQHIRDGLDFDVEAASGEPESSNAV